MHALSRGHARVPQKQYLLKKHVCLIRRSAQKVSWMRDFDPLYTIFTFGSEPNYFPIFIHLREPGLISAGFQWTDSTPAEFLEAFRVASPPPHPSPTSEILPKSALAARFTDLRSKSGDFRTVTIQYIHEFKRKDPST